GTTHVLDDLFFVIATQNPVEFRGTYPLPEAQMDRFAVRLALGYVSADEEVGILTAQELEHPLERISTRVSVDDVRRLKAAVKAVRLSPELKRYTVDIVRASRDRPSVQLGAGPRAARAPCAGARVDRRRRFRHARPHPGNGVAGAGAPPGTRPAGEVLRRHRATG